MKDTKNKLESRVVATKELLPIPGMAEKLIEGKNTPISECIPESEVDL